MSHGQSRYIPMSYYDSLADARRTLKENSLIALELQTDLLEWLGRSASKEAYAQFMRVYGWRKVGDQDERERLGSYLHTMVSEVVGMASTYYVSPDMCELTKLAAEDMPAAGLQPTDMPTDTGFLVYDRPVSLMSNVGGGDYEGDPDLSPMDTPDGTPVETKIAAVAWRAGHVRRMITDEDGVEEEESVPGITYYLFSTPHDMAVTMNLSATAVGEEATTDVDDVRRGNGPLPIWDFSGWAYNTPWFATDEENIGHAIELNQEGEQEPLSGVHSIVDQARRLMMATWRILQQKNIVVLDPNRPPRQWRRRAERAGVDRSSEDIVIIRMRREVFVGLKNSAGVEEGESWYSIRFPVRGHWHNYWTGPKGNQKLVPKYVMPYEKGPEGAPFVASRKIISLEE